MSDNVTLFPGYLNLTQQLSSPICFYYMSKIFSTVYHRVGSLLAPGFHHISSTRVIQLRDGPLQDKPTVAPMLRPPGIYGIAEQVTGEQISVRSQKICGRDRHVAGERTYTLLEMGR